MVALTSALRDRWVRTRAYRRDVAEKRETKVVVKRRVDRGRRVNHEECVAVWRRLHDYLGSDIGAGAHPILDDERLAEALGELLADQARDHVGSAAGGITDNDAHRPRRIGLRPRETRHGRQRGSAGGQMEKISAWKFQLEPPITSFDHLVGNGEHARRSRASNPDDRSRYAIANRPFAPRRSPCWQPNDRARRRPRCRSDSECRPKFATRWLLEVARHACRQHAGTGTRGWRPWRSKGSRARLDSSDGSVSRTVVLRLGRVGRGEWPSRHICYPSRRCLHPAR